MRYLTVLLIAGLSFVGSPLFGLQANTPVPEMLRIPAGAFLMGSDEGATWEKPVHRVEVSEFWIAKRPVTNREFRAFRPNHRSPGGEHGSGDADDRPVTEVSWEDAAAYCRWLSNLTGQKFRLPTEAEWERAARGGLEQKKYPWGDEPPIPEDKLDDENYQPEPRPNAFGVFAGVTNLWEWTADWYDPEYYEKSPPKDPPGPASGNYRVLRGGGYRNDPNSAYCWNRGSARPGGASELITFRVARDGARPTPAVSEQRSPAPTPAPAVEEKPTASGGLVEVSEITVDRADGELIVTASTTGPPQYKTMRLAQPDRLVIDLLNTLMKTSRESRSLVVNDLGVSRVRSAQFQAEPPTARIVVDMETALDFEIEVGDSGLSVHLKPKS